MKKVLVLLACMPVCFSLFSGCTVDMSGTEQSPVHDQSENLFFDVALPDQDEVPFVGYFPDDPSGDIIYDFKDPENADGIVVTPKE